MLDQFKPVAGGKFIEFRPSGEDFKIAADRSEQMGVLANSYTRGAGRMSGFLGEIATEKYLSEFIDKDIPATKSYDLMTHSNVSIEVKTKMTRAIPKPEYSASVEMKRTHMFENDLFVFLRCHDSLAKLWLIGWVKTDSFKRRSEFKKAGEPDGGNGFTYRVDGYHIPISKLKKMEDLRSYLGSC
jgi:hypothetical protein